MKKLIIVVCLIMMPGARAGAQSVSEGLPAGSIGSAQLAGEGLRKNLFLLGVGFATDWDDNAFNTAQAPVTQVLYKVVPRAAWNVTRSRIAWAVDYKGEESRSSKFDFYDRESHAVSMDLDWRVAKTLTFKLHNDFSRSADPRFWGNANGSEFVPGNGVADHPNGSFFGGVAERTSENGGADAIFTVAAHTQVGVGGAFTLLNYEHQQGATSLLPETYVASGRGFFDHQFSAHTSIEGSYTFQKITLPGGWYSKSHRPVLTYTARLTAATQISLSGGPDYVTATLPTGLLSPSSVAVQRWSWFAAAAYSWAGRRTGIGIKFVRQTSDGGGLIAPVRLNSAAFSVRRRLARQWSASLGGSYNINEALQEKSAAGISPRYGSADASLTWEMLKNFSMVLAYSRQERSTVFQNVGENAWIDRNRATISFDYSFTHSLEK
jgi:hypothetical protein